MWSQYTTGRISLDRYLGVELLGHKYLHLQPSKNNASLFSKAIVPIHTPSASGWASPPTSTTSTCGEAVLPEFKIFANQVRIWWYPTVVLISIWLIRNEAEHLLKYLVLHTCFVFCKMPRYAFCLFFYWVVASWCFWTARLRYNSIPFNLPIQCVKFSDF